MRVLATLNEQPSIIKTVRKTCQYLPWKTWSCLKQFGFHGWRPLLLFSIPAKGLECPQHSLEGSNKLGFVVTGYLLLFAISAKRLHLFSLLLFPTEDLTKTSIRSLEILMCRYNIIIWLLRRQRMGIRFIFRVYN